MYRKQSRKLNGAAGAALVASLAMVGGSFAATALAGPASADTTTTVPPTTTTSTLPPTTTTSLVPVTAVPAAPAGGWKLQEIQAKAAVAITNRVNTLSKLVTKVQGDSFLGTDGTTVVTHLQADIAGLQALGSKISGDTTVAQALADYRSIFSQYRVYWFVVPDTNLVINTDSLLNVSVPAVQKNITALQGELVNGDPQDAAKALSNAQYLVNKAQTALNGVSAQLLGFTAQQWDANHKLLTTDANAVWYSKWYKDRAQLDVAQARFDIQRYNRHHHGSRSGTTTTTS